MDINSSTTTIFLTSAVMASLVTSLANITIAIFNNYRLKSIEKKKRVNELTTYRYTQLFDMLLKWKEYDATFETKDRSPSQIATDRILNSFFDSHRRFEIISPLIDEYYKKDIVYLYQQGDNLISELTAIERELKRNSSPKLKERYGKLVEEFINVSVKYTTEIEKVTHLQLEQLLKSCM